jgi:hypothetical protein
MSGNVLKFPCDASRRAPSCKSRRSKNVPPEVIKLPPKRGSLLDLAFKDKLNQLDPLSRRYVEGYMQALLDERDKH